MRKLHARCLYARSLDPANQAGRETADDSGPIARAVGPRTWINTTVHIEEIAQTLTLSQKHHVASPSAEV